MVEITWVVEYQALHKDHEDHHTPMGWRHTQGEGEEDTGVEMELWV